MTRFTKHASLTLSIALAFASGSALAYPDKTVRVIVPFPPGTVTDLVARKYAEKLSQRLGQTFVVENKPGAGGAVAAQHVANANADGYTIMFVSSSFAAAPALNSNMPYDTLNDFSGIALLGSTPTLVITNPQSGIKTLSDLIKQAESKELTYGSAGVGSAAHLACEYIAAAAGIKPLHIPYKGSNEYVAEVRAGRIDFACPPIATPLAFLHAHDLNGVTVMDNIRSPLIPEVPTTEEAGLKGVEYGIWYGMLVRRGVSPNVIETLSKSIGQINDKGDLTEPLKAQGITLKYLSPTKFDAYIKNEVSKYQQIVDNINSN